MRLRRANTNERGTVAVMFALVVTGLLGIGALMVDVGALYVEGRQLQNGAESAALAIARTCATTGCVGDTEEGLASANALDDATDVELVCGTAPGLATACPAGPAGPSGPEERHRQDRFACRPVTGTAPYVEVRTRSDAATGVPTIFRRILDSDYDNEGVRACARAAYGSPGGLTSELPLALSLCEWNFWTDFGTDYASVPYSVSDEAALYFHNTGDLGLSDCPKSSPSNANPQLPGGFGWLDTDDSCRVATDTQGDAYEKPGNSVPSDCSAADFSAMLDQVVRVPIYGSITNSTGKYDVLGYAGFHLTGYRLGGPAYTKSSPTLGMPCPASARCILGHFVQDPGPASGPLVPGPGFGAIAIKVTG